MVQRARTTAGVGYAAAGFVLLMGILTAEMTYPKARHYSTRQEISDLGATRPPHSVITQPAATIFDVTMIIAGALLLLAAAASWRVYRRRRLLGVSALFGAATFLVGVFPGNTAPHPFVALLAFVSGALTAILAGRTTAPPLRQVGAALGALSLAALAVGLLGDSSPVADALGLGGVERWIVYPVIFWLPLFGGHLLATPAPRAAPPPAVTPPPAVPPLTRTHPPGGLS